MPQLARGVASRDRAVRMIDRRDPAGAGIHARDAPCEVLLARAAPAGAGMAGHARACVEQRAESRPRREAPLKEAAFRAPASQVVGHAGDLRDGSALVEAAPSVVEGADLDERAVAARKAWQLAAYRYPEALRVRRHRDGANAIGPARRGPELDRRSGEQPAVLANAQQRAVAAVGDVEVGSAGKRRVAREVRIGDFGNWRRRCRPAG